MTHSEYTELTARLLLHSRGADHSRELMDDPGGLAVWRSVIKADNDLSRWMDERADGWNESNQGRADKGWGPTDDFRALYDAMAGFMSATDTTGKMGVLYEKTRTRCRAWMDQAVTWFPVLYPLVVRDLLESDYYQLAIRAGKITPPFIWNGRIKDLAEWLVLWRKTDTVYSSGKPNRDWKSFDRVFSIGGVRITHTQLGNAIKW